MTSPRVSNVWHVNRHSRTTTIVLSRRDATLLIRHAQAPRYAMNARSRKRLNQILTMLKESPE